MWMSSLLATVEAELSPSINESFSWYVITHFHLPNGYDTGWGSFLRNPLQLPVNKPIVIKRWCDGILVCLVCLCA